MKNNVFKLSRLSKAPTWKLLAFCLFCSILGLKAQPTPHAYDTWVFGDHNGIDATQNPPVNLTSPAFSILSWESSASYCDASGNLLFYTDSRKIWSASGVLCATQLNGSPNVNASATQGVVILPTTTPNEFMIFTVSDGLSVSNGLNYGLSYFRYNAALNTVITLPSNAPLFNNYTTEAITAIPHCNGHDFWVIVKPIITTQTSMDPNSIVPNTPPGADNTSLYAYLVTDAGVVANSPVVSSFPAGAFSINPSNNVNWAHALKGSPNRKYLATGERVAGTPVSGAMSLYRFDCGSGTLEFVSRQTQPRSAYAISFDGLSQYIYTSNGSQTIRRYDITDMESSLACGGSNYQADTLNFPGFNGISNDPLYKFQLMRLANQMQPQNQHMIVVSNKTQPPQSHRLALIPTPNAATPGFIPNTTTLTGDPNYSLPNNIDGEVVTSPIPLSCTYCPNYCGMDIWFHVEGCFSSGIWKFGDGTSITGAGYTPVASNNTTGTFLNPHHTYTTPGQYIVTFTSTDGQTCTQIVSVGNNWEETTSNTLGGDQGNDVIVDGNENVYIAGTFKTGTTFSFPCGNIPVMSTGNTTAAYIAKYDKCGNLLWVNYDVSDVNSTGTGIAIDEARGEVYMTGIGGDNSFTMKFFNTALSCLGAASAPTSFTAKQYYVAKFNASTGSYMNSYTHSFSNSSAKPGVYVAVKNNNAGSTSVFMAGSYISNTLNEVCFVHNLTNTSGFAVGWASPITTPVNASGKRVINDIAYHPISNEVLITGSFITGIQFGGISLTSAATGGDAFVFAMTAGGIVNGAAKLGVIQSIAGTMGTGTSIITNGGDIYCTGYFNYGVPNVFGSSFTYSGGSGMKYRAYVVKFNSFSFNVTAAQQIMAVTNPGDIMASGIGVDAVTSQVVVTGQFNANITSPAFSNNGGQYFNNSGGNKSYLAAFSLSALAPAWANATSDNNTPNSVHTPAKIAAINANYYSTGSYKGKLGYYFGAPASGPLNSTPSSLTNACVLRGNMNVGHFQRPAAEATGIASQENNSNLSLFDIYPNPNNGVFNILLPGAQENITIKVINNLGDVLYNKYFITLEHEQLDLGTLPAGVYYIQLNNGGNIKGVRKLIKQ